MCNFCLIAVIMFTAILARSPSPTSEDIEASQKSMLMRPGSLRYGVSLGAAAAGPFRIRLV